MKFGANLENEFDFYKMEENFLKITKEIEAMSDMLEQFKQNIPNIQLFLKYYCIYKNLICQIKLDKTASSK